MPIQLLFVVLVVLFAQSALAQQFYKWKDQKGEWHYSDFPPSGVTAEKLEIGDTPQTLEVQPSVSSTGEQTKAEQSSDHSTQAASDVDHWGQPLDICSYFLHSTQVNLCPSGYQWNLSIAPQNVSEPY